MLKNYCAILILSLCLLSACKNEKSAKAVPAKVETPSKKEVNKASNKQKKAAQKKPKTTDSKVKKGYWKNLEASVKFPEGKLEELQKLEKERKAKIAAAQDKDKPTINKDYIAKKKTLLGNKLFRSYREFDKKWKSRSK